MGFSEPNPKKILIANRGEIACRIIRTLRSMGIKSVAVYSEVDKTALHVESADEAISIGKSEPAQSYLNIESILKAAARTKAAAVHPGYGFLAENAEFAEAVKKRGMLFIGPSAKAIRLCGDKIKAKALAEKCRVPVVPGITLASGEKITDRKRLDAFLGRTGFPILIKAAAGGGGRGMRIVKKRADLPVALESARREAKSSFGSEELFIEKFIAAGRHIEVQIIGDRLGEVRHLLDRDCTMQRNHQKIIEEAPAPNLPDKVRHALLQAAVKIGKAASYSNAGTVEFLLDDKFNFYFLEVNSRLQVEHPVSEAICGLDIVRLQIEIAAGGTLHKLIPANLRANGHAIECRLCAESPEENFRPASGRLAYLHLENGHGTEVRWDSGYRSGDEVPHYYDSLIGKLIVHAATRGEALCKMEEALSQLSLAGIRSNHALLLALVRSPQFAACSHTTTFITEFLSVSTDSTELLALIGAAYLLMRGQARLASVVRHDIWNRANGYRLNGRVPIEGELSINGRPIPRLRLALTESDGFEIECGDLKKFSTTRWKINDQQVSFWHGKRFIQLRFVETASESWICGSLGNYCIKEQKPESLSLRHKKTELNPLLSSNLPGKVVQIFTAKGQRVKGGQALVVVESMKMEHPINAPADGWIVEVQVTKGKVIEAGEPLLVLRYEDTTR